MPRSQFEVKTGLFPYRPGWPMLSGLAGLLLLLGITVVEVTACRAGGSPPAQGRPAAPIRPAGFVVDTGRVVGTVSPTVYGTNYGPWMHLTPGLLPALDSAGLTYLRFPGGNWGDENDLTGEQIDEFMALARRLDAQPSISVRLRGGTPEAAAALVAYARSRNYGVRYWSIGNEPSLYPDYDTARYNTEWREFAQAMLAADPDIRLVGPDLHQYTGQADSGPYDAAGRDWLREFLRANGDLVDVVAIHRYPFPAGAATAPASPVDIWANSREWDTIIPRLRAAVREVTGRDLPLAVTEVNSHWTPATGAPATPDSFYNALWWGDVLGRMIRQQVDIVAHFALQTDTENGGWGLLARNTVRPTYYIYRLYRQFGRTLLAAASPDPQVSIYAARRDDGTITVMLINLAPTAKTGPLYLDHSPATLTAQVWLFDATHPAEHVAERVMSSGAGITLPAQSISLYVLTTPALPEQAAVNPLTP